MLPLESRIHYKFRNSLLLAEALTHPSLAYESQHRNFDNQRLEFLGDAVLQLIVTEPTGGRRRMSTLADAFESLIGAVFLDSGVEKARELVLRLLEREFGSMEEDTEEMNPKGELQECLQAIHPQAPVYRIIGESGPDHRRVFQAEVSWRQKVLACGKGKSKKEAEARAAIEALRARLWDA